MKRKNNLLLYLGIAAGVLLLVAILGKRMGWINHDAWQKVSIEKVTRRTIVETVSANGKVQPEVEVKISPDVSGEIVELLVKEGDVIKKGQLLAKIKPDIYVSNVDRARAAVNTSEANLANSRARLVQAESQFEKADASYKRNKKLMDDGTISASDFEAVKSAWEVAKADVEASKQSVLASQFQVKSADASLKESNENLAKTSIFAPVAGTVSKLNVELGERVVGTSQMAGTEMMRLANLSEMEVSVNVNENDIVRVALNDTAIIDVDAYLNRPFKGIVTEISNSANTVGLNTDQVTDFTVKIRILRESYEDLIPKDRPQLSPFRPGMSATVEIQTRKTYNAHAVPIQAVTTRDTSVHKISAGQKKDAKEESKQQQVTKAIEGNLRRECVYVVEEGIAKQVFVKTGIQDNMYIEVVSGLKEGQEVVTGPYSAISKTLKDGKQVNVVSKEQLFEEK